MIKPKFYLKPFAVYQSKVCLIEPNTNATDFDFSRSVTAKRENNKGILVDVDSNIARLNFSKGEKYPALLLEPQATNEILWSEDFTNVVWNSSEISVSSNKAIAPDGNLTADILSSTNIGGTITQSRTLSTKEYTSSFYVKRKGGTGVISMVDANGLNTEIAVTYDWQRFELTSTGTTSQIEMGFSFDEIADEIIVWGGQLELGSYASSYIKTTSIALTRDSENTYSSDFSSSNTLVGGYKARTLAMSGGVVEGLSCIADMYPIISESTFVLKLSTKGMDSQFDDLIRFAESETGSYFRIEPTGALNTYQIYGHNITASGLIQGGFEMLPNTSYNIALSYSVDSIKFFIDGISKDIITTDGALNGINKVYNESANSNNISIYSLEVYNHEFTDSELTALTK